MNNNKDNNTVVMSADEVTKVPTVCGAAGCNECYGDSKSICKTVLAYKKTLSNLRASTDTMLKNANVTIGIPRPTSGQEEFYSEHILRYSPDGKPTSHPFFFDESEITKDEVNIKTQKLAKAPENFVKNKEAVCSACNDTHRMQIGGEDDSQETTSKSKFDFNSALKRIVLLCTKRGSSHESCDETLDTIYAIACTALSMQQNSD